MGLDPLTLTAIASVTVAAVGGGAQIVQGNKSRADARHAADLQHQSQDQVEAQNAQNAAEQQRQQVREARVKQARIMQGAQNSGAADSSGELGAIGAVATNLSNNQGISLGAQQRSQAVGDLNQSAADSNFQSQQDAQLGQLYGAVGQVGQSVFGAASKDPTVAKNINSIFK